MIANAIFLWIFLHLKVTQSFLCFCVNQVYMILIQCNMFVSSTRRIFISSPVSSVVSPVAFLISPVETLLLGFILKNFSKYNIFPGELSSPHRGTETGCKTDQTSSTSGQTHTTSAQIDTASEQISTTSRQTNGQTSNTSEQTSTRSRQTTTILGVSK